MSEQRKHYRKRLSVGGEIYLPLESCNFSTQDISLSGMRAHFAITPDITDGKPVRISLPALQLEGYAYPVWQIPDTDQIGVCVGFQFDHLSGIETNRYWYDSASDL